MGRKNGRILICFNKSRKLPIVRDETFIVTYALCYMRILRIIINIGNNEHDRIINGNATVVYLTSRIDSFRVKRYKKECCLPSNCRFAFFQSFEGDFTGRGESIICSRVR